MEVRYWLRSVDVKGDINKEMELKTVNANKFV